VQIGRATQVVRGWSENIVKFDAESFGKGFAAGEFWVVQGYPENVFSEIDSSMRATTEFFIPKEGGAMYVDNMVILKDARNKELAHQFINYVHDPKVYATLADHLGYPSINVPARALRAKKANYEISELANGEFKEDLGEGVELYNKAWQEIRVGK
jgi:spermidine/putrescine transport system substrate-binding protein